jgi:hypothetical protein
MTAEEFRELALRLPESSEGVHMGHPDFRVGGKIFASLGPAEAWGMVKLAAARQASWTREAPDAFEPFNGAWGRRGATKVHLAAAKRASVRRALADAWRNVAPKALVDEYGDAVA